MFVAAAAAVLLLQFSSLSSGSGSGTGSGSGSVSVSVSGSGSGSGSGSRSPGSGFAGSGSARPSFVWLLADDLEQDFKQDRKAIMPNLKRALADGGLEFVRAVPRAAALYLCSSFREASSKQVLHR